MLESLAEIDNSIAQVQRQVRTITTTEDQHSRHSMIGAVLKRTHQRTKSYPKFITALSKMSIYEKQRSRFGALDILWDELPRGPDLHGLIGNPFTPGDGLVFTSQDLIGAENVLKDYYEAWSEVLATSSPTSRENLPKVEGLTNMAKICLVLNAMNQRALLSHFCVGEKVDLDLPLSVEKLEVILQEDKYHAANFATEQYRVVEHQWGEGGHIEISDQEPLPLVPFKQFVAGSFGTVQAVRDVRTGKIYARKEQITADARDHLLREKERLAKIRHRHVVNFEKSYQRGQQLGLLLTPVADTNLEKLLSYYREHPEQHRKLQPIILKSFGCLSHGLCHIHGRKIRHKDIKPNNILYEIGPDEKRTARFIWADFGLAYDFEESIHSRTYNPSKYSPKYAAPEIAHADAAALEMKAASLDGVHTNQDTDPDSSESAVFEPPFEAGRPLRPAHGRSADIFSYGCVFLEILSVLTKSEITGIKTPDFCFWKHITKIQGWAESQASKQGHEGPLGDLFRLAARMIRFRAKKRPKVTKILSDLASSRYADQLLCSRCLPEAQAESEAWKASRKERRSTDGGRTSDESGTSGTSCFESEEEAPRLSPKPRRNGGFLSPDHALRPRSPMRKSSVGSSKGVNGR